MNVQDFCTMEATEERIKNELYEIISRKFLDHIREKENSLREEIKEAITGQLEEDIKDNVYLFDTEESKLLEFLVSCDYVEFLEYIISQIHQHHKHNKDENKYLLKENKGLRNEINRLRELFDELSEL